MLTAAGIFFLCFGSWFAGAIYLAGDPPNYKRMAVGWAFCTIFVGAGVMLLTI